MKIKIFIIVLTILIIILVGVMSFELFHGKCGVLPCYNGQCVLNDGRRSCASLDNICSVCESKDCIVFESPRVPVVECGLNK